MTSNPKVCFEPSTETYFVSSTSVFRKLAKTLPLAHETVLEIGSSFGLATENLVKSARCVIGVEHSTEMFSILTNKFKGLEHVQILWHDCRDIYGLIEKVPNIDVLFFDMGGDAPAHIALYIVQLYLNAYKPRVAVIRNISLAGLLGDVRLCEFPKDSNYRKYRVLPPQSEILAHFVREKRRSGTKFAERKIRTLAKENGKQNNPL